MGPNANNNNQSNMLYASNIRDSEEIERYPQAQGDFGRSGMYKSRFQDNELESKRIGEMVVSEKKELLFECFERICLMAMENERLFGKCTRLEEENNEKRRELEIYKGRCENLEKSKSFDSMNEERVISLRHGLSDKQILLYITLI